MIPKPKALYTIRQRDDVILMPPCNVPHTQSWFNGLTEKPESLTEKRKPAWNMA